MYITPIKSAVPNFYGNFKHPQLVDHPDNFNVLEPEVTLSNVKEEAQRCLSCKTPRCVEACPNHNPIPFFIKAVKEDDIEKAGEILRSTQSFPSCSRICFHKCEDACVRGIKGDPVEIDKIERYIGDNTFDKPITAPDTGRKVGIIGGGPAGLTAAKELRKKGHEVHIFEADPEVGGVLRYGIPSFRLPKDSFEKEINFLKDNGVIFHTRTEVGTDVRVDDLRNMGIDALFICSGTGKPRKLNVRGEDLKGVETSHTFLKRVKLAEKKSQLYDIGDKVIVIGGGNVAMDAARSAIRLGSKKNPKDVEIVYRRSENEMPARKNEIVDAKEEGVKFDYLLAPVKVLSEADMAEYGLCSKQNPSFDKVGGVKFEVMELSDPDESGRRSIVPTGKFVRKEADTVIVALGNMPKSVIKSGFEEDGLYITADNKGQVEIDKNLQTSVDGIFAGGDVAPTGGLTLTDAIAAGRKAAESIDTYLKNLDNQNI